MQGEGSSPHSRGTLTVEVYLVMRVRIIPAFAGNTRYLIRSAFPHGDHPRIRGEHTASLSPVRGGLGSSPHSRGTP